MKSILFDLDGTLVNSSPGIKAAFNYAFEKLHLPLQTDKQLSTFIGPPLEVTFGQYFDQADEVPQPIARSAIEALTLGLILGLTEVDISDILSQETQLLLAHIAHRSRT